MAQGTTLNAGVGGDKMDTEDFGTRGKAQRVKIAVGAIDVDGGEVGSVANCLEVTSGGKSSTSLTASGVVKGSAGRLAGCLVTTALSAAAITIYDNATTNSGTIIGLLPASLAANGVYYRFDAPASNGIYASFAGTGTVTFFYD